MQLAAPARTLVVARWSVPSPARWLLLALALLALGGGAALLNLSQGTPALGLLDGARIALGAEAAERAGFVVHELRLPRVVAAVLLGAMFGLAGAIMQDTLRNPLAGPEFLGVASGASLFVAFVALFPVGLSPVWHPVLAMAAGLLTAAFVLGVMRTTTDPARVLLTGAAVTALLNAVIVALVALAPNPMIVAAIYRYLTGTLSATTWDDVALVLPWFVLAAPLALASARTLNVLRLGDDVAVGLGMPVGRIRVLLFVLAVALVAPGIAVAGPIAFVGLLAPHLARRALGTGDARVVLPMSAAAGAAVLLAGDAVGRLALRPAEVPAGVWTVVVGGPFLLLVLRRALAGGLRPA